jgi:hypothetical protein
MADRTVAKEGWMSLPDLAALLWRQRELLEKLAYRLDCEQLLLAAGRTRWLPLATTEVETLLDELQIIELQRAALSDQVSNELGLEPGATLEELSAAAQPPWTSVLTEHREAMIALTADLATSAETNRHLIEAGSRAVEAALAGLTGANVPQTSVAYDARGRAAAGPGLLRTHLDRAL